MARETIKKMIKLWHQGKTTREIAKILNYHHKTISKYLKKEGIEIKNKGNTGNHQKINPLHYNTKSERDSLIISEYIKGKGSPTIAKSLNISKRTVLKVLKDNNIKRKNSYSKKLPPLQTLKKYYNSGESITSISNKLNLPEHSIRAKLAPYIRKPGETMSNLYGIEPKIIKLYEDGLSTYDIAEILGFSNVESIRRLIKSKGLTRTKSEIQKLTSLKLSSKGFQSKPEKLVASYLESLQITFQSQYSINGWNFDFKVGNTLIEVQSYWHLLPGRIKRDQQKAKIAIKNNFKLVYLWEHQIKHELFTKELLLYQLNLKTPQKFKFSDLIIKENQPDAVKLMIWHYSQKIGRYGKEYVAYLNNTPIAACVFAPILRKETAVKQNVKHDEIMELSRFVIHPNYHKKNFGSWMISRCVKKIKLDRPNLIKLVSFADQTYNHHGNIYKASNWILDGTIPSDYWYVTPNRIIKHKKTIWNSAKKEKLTESKYVSKYKLQKVYGMPKNRFVKNLN